MNRQRVPEAKDFSGPKQLIVARFSGPNDCVNKLSHSLQRLRVSVFPPSLPGPPRMDKTSLAQPPIANAADYIDALTRPRTQSVVRKKGITGRRMRDKYREEVAVVEVVKKPR